MELGGVEGTWRLACPMPSHRIGRLKHDLQRYRYKLR